MSGVQYNFNVVNPSGTIVASTDDYTEAAEAIQGNANHIIFGQNFVERINQYRGELELYERITELTQT